MVEPDHSQPSTGRHTPGEPTQRWQTVHEPTQPTTYQTLRPKATAPAPTYKSAVHSERVDEILNRLEDRWDQIALEFEEMIVEINAGRTDEEETGLDPATELPFHNQMAEKLAGSQADTTERLIALTRLLVTEIRRIIGAVGFWDNATKQDELRKAIKRSLDESELFVYETLDELAVDFVALAKANQHRL